MKLSPTNLPKRDWRHRNVQYLSIPTAIEREHKRLSDRSERTESTSPFSHILQLGDAEEPDEAGIELWDRADYAVHAALARGELKAYFVDPKTGAACELPLSYWVDSSTGAIIFRHSGRPRTPVDAVAEDLPPAVPSTGSECPKFKTAADLESFGYVNAAEIDPEYNDVEVGIPRHKFQTWFEMRPAPVHAPLPDERIQAWYDALPAIARSLSNREKLHKDAKTALGERVTMIQIRQIDRRDEGPKRGRVPKAKRIATSV